MYLAYIDESGDEGFPETSSNLFLLSTIYMHHQSWKDNWNKIYQFRKELKKYYNFPIKLELHTKAFLTDKKPYRNLGISFEEKKELLKKLFLMISTLDLKIVNVAIRKDKVKDKNYNILDRALTYLIQRIENDLTKQDKNNKFIIIADEGRIPKMVTTARRIQKINYIQSLIKEEKYRKEIKSLIEDPLPKNSEQSWFIQLADAIASIVYYYVQNKIGTGHIPNRMRNLIDDDDIIELMESIKGRLNTDASSRDDFGVVIYPR